LGAGWAVKDEEDFEASAEAELAAWVQAMRDSESVRDGVLWPNLDPSECARRMEIIRRHYPDLLPLIALAQDGEERARAVMLEYWSQIQLQRIHKSYTDYAYTLVASSIDLICTADGLNFEDKAEAENTLWQACEDRLTQVAFDGEFGEYFLRTACSQHLLKRETLVDCSDRDGLECHQYATNWATSLEDLRILSERGSVDTQMGVLSNPMATKDVLMQASGAMSSYPKDSWEEFLQQDPVNGPDMEWLEDAAPDSIREIERILDSPSAWLRVAENPMLPGESLFRLWCRVPGHNLETKLLASILLNPACTERFLFSVSVEALPAMSWNVVCLAANPSTPPNVLADIARLDRTQEVHIINELEGTMDDVLVGVALNPNTPETTRTALALMGIEKVSTALSATSVT
jgi:hypothetical protein